MEFEDVSEKAQLEIKRVAAAFEVKEWNFRGHNTYQGKSGIYWVRWKLRYRKLFFIGVGEEENITTSLFIFGREEAYDLDVGVKNILPGEHEFMARGLYCLGIVNERIFAELPPLSNHEKLELRLSMPREFWPKTWLDDERELRTGSSYAE